MDFVRQQLAVLQERFAGLTASQKMLTAALVIIMVMTLLYWGRFATDRDMVAILPNALQGEALSNVTNALSAKGISFDATGGVVKVPFDKQADAIGVIAFNEALPAMSVNAFDTMLATINPLDTQGMMTAKMKSGREARLAQIMQRWEGVKSAMVVITDAERGALVDAEPRASIDIQTRGGGNKNKLAKAAASFVVNAVSGLDRDHLTVTVDMTPMLGSGSTDSMATGTFLEIKSKFEADEATRLRLLFSDIPGLYVTVTADVDAKTTNEKSHTVDPTNKVSMVKTEDTEKTETVDPPSNEPGVMPNVGVPDVNGAVASKSGSKSETSKIENDNFVGQTERTVNTPAGVCKVVAANLRVPWSHFRNSWKGKFRKDPSDDELTAFADKEMAKLQSQVKANTQISNDAMVTVAEYFDAESIGDVQPVLTASAGGGVMSLATGHAKEVAIGALALTSLFMVSRMVKKSTPPSAQTPLVLDDLPGGIGAAKARMAKQAAALGDGIDLAGEVAESGSIMMGQELDEEVLETSQMVDQVTGFVKDNPDTAAQLVRRWLNRE